MGRKPRRRPKHLAEKLLQIRSELGLSQTDLLRQLGFEELIDYRRISEYELGEAEPPWPILLRYARIAGLCLDYIIDDEIELPDKLPGQTRHDEIKGISKKRR